MPSTQARAGVRARVREAGRRTGAAVRTATPYSIVALLAAAVVAPIAPGSSLLAFTVSTLDEENDDKINDTPGVADVIVWDLRTGSGRALLETPGSSPIARGFTPDGSRLVAAANHTRSGGTLSRVAQRVRVRSPVERGKAARTDKLAPAVADARRLPFIPTSGVGRLADPKERLASWL